MDGTDETDGRALHLRCCQVNSSVLQGFLVCLDSIKCTAPSHYVDSVVSVMFEATEKYDHPHTGYGA